MSMIDLTTVMQIQEMDLDKLCDYIMYSKSSENLEAVFRLKKSKLIKSYLARNKYTPLNILQSLSKNKDLNILANLLENENLQGKSIMNIFQRIIQSELDNFRIREIINGIACHRNTPEQILKDIFFSNILSTDQSIKYNLAQNPNLPKNLLLNLINDENMQVRFYAASNPNLDDIEILQKLVEDANSLIRSGVALNPNSTLSMQKMLSLDKDWMVKYRLAKTTKNLDILQKLQNDKNLKVLEAIISNKNCSENIITQILEKNPNNTDFCYTVLDNPNISDDILFNIYKNHRNIIYLYISLSKLDKHFYNEELLIQYQRVRKFFERMETNV